MVEATRVAKVVAVVFAVGAVAAVVWWAQSRGERVAAVGPTRVQQQSLRPEPPPPAPVPKPRSILADRPLRADEPGPHDSKAKWTDRTGGSALQGEDGKLRDPNVEPFRDTYFSTSKSAFAPNFDEPTPDNKEMARKLQDAMDAPFGEPGKAEVVEPGPDAR